MLSWIISLFCKLISDFHTSSITIQCFTPWHNFSPPFLLNFDIKITEKLSLITYSWNWNLPIYRIFVSFVDIWHLTAHDVVGDRTWGDMIVGCLSSSGIRVMSRRSSGHVHVGRSWSLMNSIHLVEGCSGMRIVVQWSWGHSFHPRRWPGTCIVLKNDNRN